MSKIRAIVFDVGGVLHKNSRGLKDELAKKLDLLEESIDKIWDKQIILLGSGHIDEQTFWEQLQKEYHVRHVELKENLLGSFFKKSFEPRQSMLDLVMSLSEKGYTLAVLSNTIEPHANILRSLGVYDNFNYVFLSHEIKLRKPDPAAFLYVLKRLGMEPHEVLLIDDTTENIEAAKAIGIPGIIFISEDQMVTDIQKMLK